MIQTHQLDFLVRSHGSVWTFEPLTEAVKDFTTTGIDVHDWQWLGPGFGVDHRLANDLVTALEGEGFALGSD
jgi:hypothetical protein